MGFLGWRIRGLREIRDAVERILTHVKQRTHQNSAWSSSLRFALSVGRMDYAENQRPADQSEDASHAELRHLSAPSRMRMPKAYRVCDGVTEWLV